MSKYQALVIRNFAVFFLLFAEAAILNAQNLTFTHPEIFLPMAKTDKAIDITNFKGGYFVTWKEPGDFGKIKFSYLGRLYDTETISTEKFIPNGQSAYGPVLRAVEKNIYIFWISKEGNLKYIINNSDTGFDTANVMEVKFTSKVKLSLGVSAADAGGKIMIGAHTENKNQLVYSLLVPGPGGHFGDAEAMLINDARSPDYPFVVGLNASSARFCWRGKDDAAYYADYNIDTKTWTESLPVATAKTKCAPAVYHVWGGDRLFYIWRGNKNDNRLYYATARDAEEPAKQGMLPGFFSTNLPVSITKIDGNNFLLAYTGTDNHLYISNFSNYDPSSWMQEILSAATSKKTLRDIVIPGSHDAAMSILNGVGGQQKGTINQCNTLTQTLTIEQQLNAGIRMFDLRAGTYQQELYAKHCSSDCMEDALGGGYGEKLGDVADGIRRFLRQNKQEIILLTFSHFCERETPIAGLKDNLLKRIGRELIHTAPGASIGTVPLSELAGKVIISFEVESKEDSLFPNNTIASNSDAFINFKRNYAATRDVKVLMQKEKQFFDLMKNGVRDNDIIRLDWQLTQTADEAPMICNDFEDESLNPIVSGLMMLTNAARKHKSIIDRSLNGNKYLPVTLSGWISDGTVNKKNKPNILFVDVAGGWITDYCIDLNKTELYK